MVQVDRDLCDGRCCVGGRSGGAVLSTPLAPLGFVLCPLSLQSPLYLTIEEAEYSCHKQALVMH